MTFFRSLKKFANFGVNLIFRLQEEVLKVFFKGKKRSSTGYSFILQQPATLNLSPVTAMSRWKFNFVVLSKVSIYFQFNGSFFPGSGLAVKILPLDALAILTHFFTRMSIDQRSATTKVMVPKGTGLQSSNALRQTHRMHAIAFAAFLR